MISNRERNSSGAFPLLIFVFLFASAYFGLQLLNSSALAHSIPVSTDHHTEHTVVVGSSNEATQIFAELQGRWPPDPNEQDPLKKVVCYVLKEGNNILRYMVWAGSHYSATGLARGDLIWYQYGGNGPEVYGYSNKSLGTMQNIPKDLSEMEGRNFRVVETDCNNFTPPFGLLSP